MYSPASAFLHHHFSHSSETVSLRVFSWAQLGFSIRSLRQTRPRIWELQPWFIILQVGPHLDSTLRCAPLDFLVSCNEHLLLLDIDSCVQSMPSAICPDSRILLHFFGADKCSSRGSAVFVSAACLGPLVERGLFWLGRLASLLPPPWREPRLVPHLRPASLSHCWDLNVCCFSWLQMAHPVGGGFMCSSFLPRCHLSLTSWETLQSIL